MVTERLIEGWIQTKPNNITINLIPVMIHDTLLCFDMPVE